MSKQKPVRFVLDTAKLVLAGASRRHKLKVWMNQITISSNPHDLQSIIAQLRILQATTRPDDLSQIIFPAQVSHKVQEEIYRK